MEEPYEVDNPKFVSFLAPDICSSPLLPIVTSRSSTNTANESFCAHTLGTANQLMTRVSMIMGGSSCPHPPIEPSIYWITETGACVWRFSMEKTPHVVRFNPDLNHEFLAGKQQLTSTSVVPTLIYTFQGFSGNKTCQFDTRSGKVFQSV